MNQTIHPTLPPTATAGIPTAPVSLPRGGEFLTCRLPASVARISAHPTYPLRAIAGIPTRPASFPRPTKALSVSAGIPTAPVSLRRGGEFLTCRLPASRSAFTLVELLVVIGIIATLAALVTPAVMRAQAAAGNAAIKAEIDMLHMAIMNYKNEHGSFPPCDVASYTGSDSASKHIMRLFPRTTSVTNELAGFPSLTPCNSLIAWLGGYKNDPTSPLKGLGERKKLFDYDSSRLDSSQLVYFPAGKPGSPYVYIVRSEYGKRWPTSAAPYTVGVNSYTIAADTYFAQPQNGSYSNTGPFANPDTFQILCAGRDEIFGNDDDLSNFWPGTRKDFQDSLNQ